MLHPNLITFQRLIRSIKCFIFSNNHLKHERAARKKNNFMPTQHVDIQCLKKVQNEWCIKLQTRTNVSGKTGNVFSYRNYYDHIMINKWYPIIVITDKSVH